VTSGGTLVIPAYNVNLLSREKVTVNAQQVSKAKLIVNAVVTGIKAGGSSRDKLLEAPETVSSQDIKAGTLGES